MSKIYEALEMAEQVRLTKDDEVVQSSSANDVLLPTDPRVVENMVRLYQNMSAILPEAGSRVILFIGAQKGEGTSTIIREFAKVSVAKRGMKVLLVDVDPLHSGHNSALNVDFEAGWDAEDLDNITIDGLVQQVNTSGLFVSDIRQNGSSSHSFLESSKMDTLLDKFRENFDLIVLDSPPANVSPDGLALCRRVDGVVLVVQAEKTRWQVVENVRDKIINQGGNILGVVLNKRRHHIPEFIYKRL